MTHFDCDATYLRGVINGTIKFRKCPQCDNEGREIQAYDDMGEPCANDNPEAEHDPCTACHGVAFIEIPE